MEDVDIHDVPVRRSYATWKVTDFSNLIGEVWSDVFTGAGYTWQIRMYPKGDVKHTDKFLSLYIDVATSWNLSDQCDAISASGELAIHSQLETSHNTKECVYGGFTRTVTKSATGWGFPQFMRLAELINPQNGFLYDNTLVIEACVSVPHDEPVQRPRTRHQRQQLQRYLGHVNDDSFLSDVELEVDGVKFPAHKLILAQAPFFRTMFSTGVGHTDAHHSVVKIQQHGVTPEAMRVVLAFLYTCSAVLPRGTALLEVHCAARFFMLTGLEDICHEAFTDNLDLEVLVSYMRYAHAHDLEKLKQWCYTYASKWIWKFMVTDDFIHLVTHDGVLFKELAHHLQENARVNMSTPKKTGA